MKYRCPPLKEYSKDQERQSAEELSTLKRPSITLLIVTDYHNLRDQCRAAK